jgi:hypothetical protein
MSTLLPATTGAEFSPCRRYRYTLWRRWSSGPALLFLMLNPSTADETANDPTVERCQRRAMAAGYGCLFVANIFALRSTDPAGLRAVDDPVGPKNDVAILALAHASDQVICGWGNHGRLHGRGRQVLAMLREHGIEPHCLRVTGAGEPGHPLYIGYDVQPVPMSFQED